MIANNFVQKHSPACALAKPAAPLVFFPGVFSLFPECFRKGETAVSIVAYDRCLQRVGAGFEKQRDQAGFTSFGLRI